MSSVSVQNTIQTRLWQDILPNTHFYFLAAPIFIFLVASMITLLLGVFKSAPDKPSYPAFVVALLAAVAASVAPFVCSKSVVQAFLGSGVLIDGITQVSFVVISLGTLFTLVAASGTQAGRLLLRSELISLLLLSSAGLMVMCAAGEFMSFFVGLELMSIPLYVLVGYQRKTLQSLEAAVKYFLLGAAAAAMLLMGTALLYFHLGTLRFSDLHLLQVTWSQPFVLIGLLFVVCGLAFKFALAPFHLWAPDVYQGAHSLLSGYMASLVKYSVAIVFLRIFSVSFSGAAKAHFVTIFWFLGALSIAAGSLFGLVSQSVKRMLAYSSVANAGYFCLIFAALVLNPNSVAAKQAVLSYAIIYVVLSLGAFSVLAWFEDSNREDLLREELAGVGQKKPFAAFALSVFLFGLAGIPPLAGFFGKFLILVAALHEGLLGISILFVLLTCVSLYYYLNVIVEMWFKAPTRHSIQSNQSASTEAVFKPLIFIILVISILVGWLGPRVAMQTDFKQASEMAPSPRSVK